MKRKIPSIKSTVYGGLSLLFLWMPLSFVQADESALTWKPWISGPAEALRPQAPPDESATVAELSQIHSASNEASAIQNDRARYWNAGAANYRWMQMILDRYAKGPPSAFKARGLALLNVAIYDAVATASQAKKHWQRPRPVGVAAARDMPTNSSYPSARAAAASAAAGVLHYLFPDDPEDFDALATEAAQARVVAGFNYPSDIQTGLTIGKVIADQIILHAKTDNSDSLWTGQAPTGEDKFAAEQLIGITVPQWSTWVIGPLNDYLPIPPPALESAKQSAELEVLRSIERTVPVSIAGWMNHATYRAIHWWYEQIADAVFEYGWDNDLPRAAHAYATIAVTNFDALTACFNAKYTYWRLRPTQLDETLTSLFPHPSHPSYPAAHSCSTMSIAVTIGHFFPDHAQATMKAAETAGQSRIIAGVHYPSDRVAGEVLGRQVAEEVVQYSKKLIVQ